VLPQPSRKTARIAPEIDAASGELIAGFLKGELSAVRTIAGWAETVARYEAWGFETPEDVVQATMLALVQNFRDGRFAGGNLRAYVRRIAKNHCVTNYRRMRSRGEHVSLDDIASGLAAAPSYVDGEDKLSLKAVLDELDDGCRRIVLLAYMEGQSRDEIARQMDISVEAARVRLFRCLQRARSIAQGEER
jgi:RNA polymerase sigma-70 factor (ECF subfamily)